MITKVNKFLQHPYKFKHSQNINKYVKKKNRKSNDNKSQNDIEMCSNPTIILLHTPESSNHFIIRKPDKKMYKKKVEEKTLNNNKSYFSSVLHIYHKTTLASPTFNLHPTQTDRPNRQNIIFFYVNCDIHIYIFTWLYLVTIRKKIENQNRKLLNFVILESQLTIYWRPFFTRNFQL